MMAAAKTKLHPSQIDGPDARGRIRVGLSHRLTQSPEIPGYEPYWVNVDMTRDPIKIVTYKPTTTKEQ